MADSTKYQLFLNELLSMENQISALLEQIKHSEELKIDLERQSQLLRKENELLKVQVDTYVKEIELLKSGKMATGINEKERSVFKQKIQDAMKKIDGILDSATI
ncbi:MAG: hypothetical protein LWX56_14285 [Ignavibacteria bacterium]|nr:hypothetical protein [Ignavibacteria bacterium]